MLGPLEVGHEQVPVYTPVTRHCRTILLAELLDPNSKRSTDQLSLLSKGRRHHLMNTVTLKKLIK